MAVAALKSRSPELSGGTSLASKLLSVWLAVIFLFSIPLPSDASDGAVIFTIDFCPACLAAKQYFASQDVAVTELNIDQSDYAREKFAELGGRGIPLIFWGGRRYDGFHPSRMPQSSAPVDFNQPDSNGDVP